MVRELFLDLVSPDNFTSRRFSPPPMSRVGAASSRVEPAIRLADIQFDSYEDGWSFIESQIDRLEGIVDRFCYMYKSPNSLSLCDLTHSTLFSSQSLQEHVFKHWVRQSVLGGV